MTDRKPTEQATAGQIPTGPTRSKEDLVTGVKDGTINPLNLKAEEFLMLQNDEAFQSPLMKQYNKLVQDDGRLNVTILASMQRLIKKQMNPTWELYEGTLNWQTWAMNLTEANKQKVQGRWNTLYTALMSADSAPEETAAPVVAVKKEEAPKAPLSAEEEQILDDLLTRKYSSDKA